MTYSKNLPIKDTLHKMDTSLCPNGVRLREVPLCIYIYIYIALILLPRPIRNCMPPAVCEASLTSHICNLLRRVAMFGFQ